nr:TonB-dependent receptor [Ottowia testudinis]
MAGAAALLCLAAQAQQQPEPAPTHDGDTPSLGAVTVRASADASAQGLSPAYAGGQVARGARAGILGTQDAMNTPFSTTAYTQELIQDKQARSVGDVLQNDPGVRVARGFGNFQESYFIRGFIVGSDDSAYNGLYGLLPRQYIASELFERVEVLRGASAFLNGAAPGGGGLGGTLNLLPKRAPNEPLTRVDLNAASGSQWGAAVDVARRFGPDQSAGVRLNLARRQGGTGIDQEKVDLGLAALGLDWHSARARLSADLGWQDHRLKQTRTNVTLGAGVAQVPHAPDTRANFAQTWTFSNERDVFGTLRGEYDLSDQVTAWAAWGMRRGNEANALANLTLNNGASGAGRAYRFDNTRQDRVSTGEIGLRGKRRTGAVGHEWVASASSFSLEVDNAYVMDWRNTFATNLYAPAFVALPGFSAGALRGNDLQRPALNRGTHMSSIALGNTLSLAGDAVRLTLGLRHQRLQLKNYAYNTGALASNYDKSRLSPALGVVVKPTKQLSLYANYIEGLSQGETAPATAVNVGEMLAPYVAKQTEVGVKYDLGRMGLGLALFSTEKPRSLLDADKHFTGGGRDRHRGAEFTVYGEAARGLRLLGGMTWLQATQQRTGVAATEGRRVIGVPRFQASLGADWDIPGVRGLTLDGRVTHTGASFANASNTLRVPGWTRLDAGVRYLTEVNGQLLTLRLRVNNLANRRYWASVGGHPGSGYLVAAAPRSISFSASIDF